MLGGIALGKKIIRRKQQVRLQEGHLQRLKNARPSTTGYDWQEGPRILNNGKKQMLIQNKFTQIQRQNRLLLQKITTNLNKRNSKQLDGGRERMNKSLHSNFRKKQLQNIEIQNARLLRRLQQKKSDYQTQKLHQDWKKQKAVIKNIANFPIVISDGSRKQKRRAYSRGLNIRPSLDHNSMNDEIEMMRIRKIDEINMVITVKLNSEHLTIIGDTKRGKDIKVIQVPRDEAIQFINEECDGKIQKIFDRLHYDGKDDLLYLLAKDAEIGNPQDNIQEAPLLSQQ